MDGWRPLPSIYNVYGTTVGVLRTWRGMMLALCPRRCVVGRKFLFTIIRKDGIDPAAPCRNRLASFSAICDARRNQLVVAVNFAGVSGRQSGRLTEVVAEVGSASVRRIAPPRGTEPWCRPLVFHGRGGLSSSYIGCVTRIIPTVIGLMALRRRCSCGLGVTHVQRTRRVNTLRRRERT